MKNFLEKLYQKFLNFKKKFFLKDSFFQLGVSQLKIGKKELNYFFENYYKVPFFEFLSDLKLILFSKNPSEFILKKGSDNWDLWYYLEFLKREKILRIESDRKVILQKKEILEFLPRPKNKEEIKKTLEKKLRKKVKEERPISELFGREKITPELDQLPLSQGSVLFLAEKILERISNFYPFLLVGDDDLLSLTLCLTEPKLKVKVIDLDNNLLSFIENFSKKFNLKIETQRVDITKKKKLSGRFCGFLANPAYTEEGVKQFLDFGISNLKEEGGVVFLVLGDEAIGNRMLFLEEFFAKKQLLLREAILGKIFYPQVILHKEDRIIEERLKELNQEPVRLGATLFIFDYIPFKIKKIKFKKPMIAYI
jgi:hypothetical protein